MGRGWYVLLVLWTLSVVVGLTLAYRSERRVARCPECVGPERECPPAEKHPVDAWVCEPEDEWAKALMDCTGYQEATAQYSKIIGEQEVELEWWRARCDPQAQGARETIQQMREELERWHIERAAKRAVERRETGTDG